MLGRKRKISLADGSEVCDKTSKFTDNSDGSVSYKSGFFSKIQSFQGVHIVRDEKGWGTACASSKDKSS